MLRIRAKSTWQFDSIAAFTLLKARKGAVPRRPPPSRGSRCTRKSCAERMAWLFAWLLPDGFIVCLNMIANEQCADTNMRCGYACSGKALPDYTQILGKIRSAMCCSILAVRSLGSYDSAETCAWTWEAVQREPLLAAARLFALLAVVLSAFLLGWERKVRYSYFFIIAKRTMAKVSNCYVINWEKGITVSSVRNNDIPL